MAVKTPDSREEQDAAYNPGEIHAQEQFGNDYVSDGLDKAEKYANDAANATKSEEENPTTPPGEIPYEKNSTSTPKSGRFNFSLGGLKKKGPILSIILLVAGVGLGGSTLFGPALLLVQMKEVFSNYGGSASRAAPLRYSQRLIYQIGNKKVEKACNKNPASRRCTLGTISEKDRAHYEKNGFKFNNAKEVNGRTVIREVEFPDGKKVKSGKAFNSYVKKNPSMASRAMAAHNPRTLIFNGGRFSRIVLKKFGLDKSKVTLNGDDDKERKEEFDKSAHATPDDEENRESKVKGETEEKTRKLSLKKGLAAVPGLACFAYNMSRLAIATVKVENSLKFVGFALLFLKAADQIKDEGSIDPGTVATLGGILTSYASSGPKKGLTATDSQGYKVAAYGGEGALQKWSQSFLLDGSPALVKLDNTIKWLSSTVKKSGLSVRSYCKALGGIVGQAAGVGVCATGGGGAEGLVAGSVVPVLGNAVGWAVGTIGCVAAGLLISVALGKVIEAGVKLVLPIVVNALKDAPISADIAGVDAGNALAIGASVLLGTTALSRGMKPANKKDVANFEVATADSEKQYDDIAKYDAKKTPFDIYNQYSFLGSLIRESGITYSPNNSLLQSLQNVGTLLSSSVRATPSALALASMPLPITDKDLSNCPDQDLVDIGVDCDRMGQMQLTMSAEELNMPEEDNLNYMEDNGYVDDEGTVNEDKDYAKFVQYCTDQREYLMGSTGEPIEDTDDWVTGKACTEDSEKLSNFRVYYFDQGDSDDSDYNTGVTNSATAITPGAGSQFRIASFNMRGACHTLANVADQCNANQSSDTRDHRDYKERMGYSYKVITEEHYDIVGFQEFQGKQKDLLKQKLPNFAFSSKSGDNSIGWNSDKFTKVNEGLMPDLLYSGNGKLIAPYVRLKDKSTGQEFYVMNTHDPANVFSNAGNNRQHDTDQHVKFIQKLKNDGIPILFTGDFNSPYSAKAGSNSYCGITQAKYNSSNVVALADSYDVHSGRAVKCPNKNAKIDGHTVSIDRVYVSDGVLVTGMSSVASGYTSDGSDHPTVAADITIPGSDDSQDGDVNVGDVDLTGISIRKYPHPLTQHEGTGKVEHITPKGVTLHWWGYEGNIDSLANTLRTRKPDPLSVQFGITNDGQIYQMMKDEDSWAAHAVGGNDTTFGIEMEGTPADFGAAGIKKYPKKFAAAVYLVKYLVKKYHLKLDGATTCDNVVGVHPHKAYNHCGNTKTDIDDVYFNAVMEKVRQP